MGNDLPRLIAERPSPAALRFVLVQRGPGEPRSEREYSSRPSMARTSIKSFQRDVIVIVVEVGISPGLGPCVSHRDKRLDLACAVLTNLNGF
jgi:hypothetical protein